MHIAIDARSIFTGGSGDRTYFRNVIENMARMSPGDRWTLYADGNDPDRDSLRAPNIVLADPLPAPVGALWNVTRLVPQMRRDGVDLLHSQYMLPPFGPAPCPMVVTIHDATFRLFPSWFPGHENRVRNLLIPRAAQRAARVITGSHSAAGDIHATMNVSREKIAVTPYGLDERFEVVPAAAQKTLRAKYGLPDTYLLGVGLLRPRKNVTVVLEAIDTLIEQEQWPSGSLLALTGDWKGTHQGAAFLSEHPRLNEYVRVLGYVPDADLPGLYSGATLSVYPSLYEGFGFPALESMACGCPVISTNTSSLPEVVGDAGVSLPPDDVSLWAKTIHRLLTYPQERDDLRQKGLKRAKTFTWERTARQTLAIYREVIAKKS